MSKVINTTLTTYEGHALTPKESKFIDAYLETGNATEAVRRAGYKTKAHRQMGTKILSRGYISREIDHQLEMMKEQSIANATEILQYFTSVMRGEVKDQFGLEASLGERTKAAQELAKRKIDIPEKLRGNSQQAEVRITLDWGDENE